MSAAQPVTISAVYVNGAPLPAPREVQAVSAASVRMVTRIPPPIDESSVVELGLSDGRRAAVRVMSIEPLGTEAQPLFAVVAAVPGPR